MKLSSDLINFWESFDWPCGLKDTFSSLCTAIKCPSINSDSLLLPKSTLESLQVLIRAF